MGLVATIYLTRFTMTSSTMQRYSSDLDQAMERTMHMALMVVITLTIVLFATELFAAGSGMPWESTLNKILASLQGPVARFVGIVAIVITGLAFALGEGGGFFKQGLAVAFGLSIAFGATTFITEFGFAGGALF